MALDLNDKPWYVPLAVGLVLGVVIYFAVNSYIFKPIRETSERLVTSIDELEREIEKGRAAQRDLPKLEEEIRGYQLELDRLRRILPTRKETDNLIKKLKQLTERGNFELRSFIPGTFQDRDFYQEWPIRVELAGTYHELGLFFDRLSRFSRIINVNNLRISPMRTEAGGQTIQAGFTQTTFIYKEVEPAGGAQ
ncbi:MAG: type 4a pilus biogenesis protein PilO [bacterium]|nr:type 4a pilus biogenesis protein PilO [bacterium]